MDNQISKNHKDIESSTGDSSINKEITEIENVIEKLNRLLDEEPEELSAELAGRAETNFDELRKEDRRKAVVIVPEYAEPINLYTARWEISNPIVLTNYSWNGPYTRGIKLNPGFYKIKYSLGVACDAPSALALFNWKTEEFRELLTWNTFWGDSKEILHHQGTRYVKIKSASILGLTDRELKLDPNYISGKYIVSIYKLYNKLP